MVKKTIFAFLSSNKKTPISIVRLSGPLTKNFLMHVCKKRIIPRKTNIVNITKSDGSFLDKVIVLFFPKPKSLTGEDLVEFHLHGSPSIIKEFEDMLMAYDGLFQAEPGEFSKQSFYNNKLDLFQIEGLGDLYDSYTQKQRIQSQNAYLGGISEKLNKWRENIIELNALIETSIDFSDEDLPKNTMKKFSDLYTNLKKDIEQQLNLSRKAIFIKEGIKIAITGPSNAGKSSLINFLVNQSISIVDSKSGTTRDIIQANLEIDGFLVNIFDTAGITETKNKIEIEGINRAINLAKSSEIQIRIVDISDQNWKEKLETIPILGLIHIDVLNKTDLMKVKINEKGMLPVSIKNSIGLDVLIKTIKEKLSDLTYTVTPPYLLRERHTKSALKIKESLERIDKLDINENPELIAEDLRMAFYEICKVTGSADIENILDNIFINFCIGK